MPAGVNIARNAHIQVTLFRNEQEKMFPAVVVFSRNDMVGAQFHELTLLQQSELVRLTFSRADIWANNWGKTRHDTPLKSLREVAGIGMNGVRELIRAALIEVRKWRARRREAAELAAAGAAAGAAGAAGGAATGAPSAAGLDNTMEEQ